MSGDDIEYVINSARAWGKGPHESEALRKVAYHWSGDVPDDGVEVAVVAVTGFQGIRNTGLSTSVEADEIHSTERLVIDPVDWSKIQSLQSDLELALEGALVDAEEVDDD